MTRAELISWFEEHRGDKSRKLSVHVSWLFCACAYLTLTYHAECVPAFQKVVGFGQEENDKEGGGNEQEGDDEDLSDSTYGEVSKLLFLPPSPRMSGAVTIMDIPAFTAGLPLFPYHKILE